jgi:hypothetical protein
MSHAKDEGKKEAKKWQWLHKFRCDR